MQKCVVNFFVFLSLLVHSLFNSMQQRPHTPEEIPVSKEISSSTLFMKITLVCSTTYLNGYLLLIPNSHFFHLEWVSGVVPYCTADCCAVQVITRERYTVPGVFVVKILVWILGIVVVYLFCWSVYGVDGVHGVVLYWCTGVRVQYAHKFASE